MRYCYDAIFLPLEKGKYEDRVSESEREGKVVDTLLLRCNLSPSLSLSKKERTEGRESERERESDCVTKRTRIFLVSENCEAGDRGRVRGGWEGGG